MKNYKIPKPMPEVKDKSFCNVCYDKGRQEAFKQPFLLLQKALAERTEMIFREIDKGYIDSESFADAYIEFIDNYKRVKKKWLEKRCKK